MTAHGGMSEFDQLDALMHAAHAKALDVLGEHINVEERLRQLLEDVENPRSGNCGPASSGA
jgi:hypothetical protein